MLYFLNALPDNMSYFAAVQFYFGLTGVYSTLVRFFSGIVTWEVIIYSVVGFVGCMTGKFVFDKLNTQRLRQLIYLGMIVSGVTMIV